MKASKSRIANAIARAEARKGGPPKVSKYAAKQARNAPKKDATDA